MTSPPSTSRPTCRTRSTARIQELSRRAFDALDAQGLARVDFFVRPDGDVVINEVNTLPGFTPISMYPRMWAKAGCPTGS